MQEVRDRVRLVDASQIGAREIRATVPRGEIQDVLSSPEGEPELVIDVNRGGGEDVRTLRLAWDAGELEQLLSRAEGADVTFTFDGAELEQALEDDVAAHGMREKAVVLAVAVTSAAATGAGVANAAFHESAASSATGATPAATSAVTSEREWPVAVHQSTSATPAPASTSQGVVSEREWPVAVHESSAAGPAPVSEREWPVGVSGPAVQATSETSATPSTAGGSDAATAAAVAGGALLISAAGFTLRRHRKAEPEPA